MLTLADGIAVKHPGAFTGPLVERWVDEIVAVDEDAIADAMVVLMDRAKLYVEGAGAVGVAAAGVRRWSGRRRPARRASCCRAATSTSASCPGLIRRHETTAGRRLVVFARIDDRPGSLVRLLGVFAAAGANLIEVEHRREGVDLHVRETGVHATFEVRSRDHAAAVVDAVRRRRLPRPRAGRQRDRLIGSSRRIARELGPRSDRFGPRPQRARLSGRGVG